MLNPINGIKRALNHLDINNIDGASLGGVFIGVVLVVVHTDRVEAALLAAADEDGLAVAARHGPTVGGHFTTVVAANALSAM